MLIDLHSHTWPRSHDSVLNPDDLITRAKSAGLDAIVFTEHDTVWDYKSVEELRAKHNFLVLAGVEISTDDGHILAFGIDKYVFGMHRARELASYVEKANGAMVAAHPYRRQMPWFSRRSPVTWRRLSMRICESHRTASNGPACTGRDSALRHAIW